MSTVHEYEQYPIQKYYIIHRIKITQRFYDASNDRFTYKVTADIGLRNEHQARQVYDVLKKYYLFLGKEDKRPLYSRELCIYDEKTNYLHSLTGIKWTIDQIEKWTAKLYEHSYDYKENEALKYDDYTCAALKIVDEKKLERRKNILGRSKYFLMT